MADWSTFHGRFAWAVEQAVEAGTSREDIAGRIGTASTRISEWAGGAKNPSLKFVKQLPGAVGVDGHWLLTGEGEPHRIRDGVATSEPAVADAVHHLREALSVLVESESVQVLGPKSFYAILTRLKSELDRVSEGANDPFSVAVRSVNRQVARHPDYFTGEAKRAWELYVEMAEDLGQYDPNAEGDVLGDDVDESSSSDEDDPEPPTFGKDTPAG